MARRKVRELHAFRRHSVEVGRAHQFIAERADVGVAHVINEDEDDVGLGVVGRSLPASGASNQTARSAMMYFMENCDLMPTA